MKIAPRFRGDIVEDRGKKRIAISNQLRYHDYVHSLKLNQPVWITIETEENKRTLSQNNYYHLYLDIVADETGDDHNSLHEYFKRLFLPPRKLKVLGKEILIPSSTTDLSKLDFSEYLDRIAALVEIPLPDPEAAGYIK